MPEGSGWSFKVGVRGNSRAGRGDLT